MYRFPRLPVCCALLLSICTLASTRATSARACQERSAEPIEIVEAVWGFGNHYVKSGFTPLTITIRNPGEVAREGFLSLDLKLWNSFGGWAAPSSAPLRLAPGALARIHFQVALEEYSLEWLTFSWNRKPIESEPFFPALDAKPAHVFLYSRAHPPAALGELVRFPEDCFPNHHAALDGLASAVLDHAPEWSPAQQQALVDWVWGGGVLHVLRDVDGAVPRLGGALGCLPAGEPGAHGFGAGAVYVHDCGRADDRVPTIAQGLLEVLGSPKRAAADPSGEWDWSTSAPPFEERELVQILARTAATEHHWGWILALAVVYLLLVAPAAYFYGRRSARPERGLYLLLATIVLFSGLFWFVGRRGAGERTSISNFTYALALEDGATYATRQWGHVFVTGGGSYALSHADGESLYRLAAGNFVGDSVPLGTFVTPIDGGTMVLSMPMFSSTAYRQAGRIRWRALVDPDPEWVQEEDGSWWPLVRTSAMFPQEVDGIWIVTDRGAYRAKRMPDGTILRVGPNPLYRSDTTVDYTGRDPQVDWKQASYWFETKLVVGAIGNGLAIMNRPPVDSLPGERVHLLIALPTPPEFQPRGVGGEQRGHTVVHYIFCKQDP